MAAVLNRISSPSLVDEVVKQIRQAILTGALRPGQPFAIGSLSNQLGVSHIPVREAIQRLEAQGLIKLRPGRSAVVAAIDAEDLRQIYQLRKLIEVDAAGRACPHLTDADLATLARDLKGMLGLSPEDDRFWQRHYAFHRTIFRPASSPWLERMLDVLWHAAERYLRIVYNETEFTDHDGHTLHIGLLEAAKQRSEPIMRRAMEDHLHGNEQVLLSGIASITRQKKGSRDRPL
ncbi:MAG: GntR family transcriptional regulator [Chloroflexi bacterium]|nr:GntR family transcriptional regulator [Chloroflexota bacterium]